MPETLRSNLKSWWEGNPEAVHQLAALFRIKQLKEFPLPPLTLNVAMEHASSSFDSRSSWQNQNPDRNMTISEPGEQVWFIKGETLGLVLMELDQNYTAKVFGYKLQQAGNPDQNIITTGQGTGRFMFSHALATTSYQPYTPMQVASEGPNGERCIGIDVPRDFDDEDVDCTIVSFTVLGNVLSIANSPQISCIAVRGGAFLPSGGPTSAYTGGGGYVNLAVANGQTVSMALFGVGDDFCFSISGVTGLVLDAGFNVSFQGHCATWKRWPAAGFWKKVSDYQNVLVQSVNFTLRNPNNEAAVPSSTVIVVATLKNCYAGWFIRQAMLGDTAFNYITNTLEGSDYQEGIYGTGLHLGLLPINTSAYQDFTELVNANQNGTQGITDVHYNLTGGSNSGTMRMYEVCVVVDCDVIVNANSNQGANALATCSVSWLWYGSDPTNESRKATADPVTYMRMQQYASFYPMYERLTDQGEVPPLGSLIQTLIDTFDMNAIAAPDLTGLGAYDYDGGGREGKLRKVINDRVSVKVKGSYLERAAAALQGKNVAL